MAKPSSGRRSQIKRTPWTCRRQSQTKVPEAASLPSSPTSITTNVFLCFFFFRRCVTWVGLCSLWQEKPNEDTQNTWIRHHGEFFKLKPLHLIFNIKTHSNPWRPWLIKGIEDKSKWHSMFLLTCHFGNGKQDLEDFQGQNKGMRHLAWNPGLWTM